MRKLPEFGRLTALLIERQRALGIDPEAFERARNTGERRTAEKRALLRAIHERAEAAGKVPIPARF